MKECPFCRGPVEERRIEHVHRWRGRLYIFSNAPAEVCGQCGEVFFAPETLRAIDAVVHGERAPDEERCLPVFSL